MLAIASFSVVVPVFNEKSLVEASLSALSNALEGCISDLEIIVIDDGSNDGTGIVLENMAKLNKNIKVLHNETNKNIGISIKRGFDYANKEFVLFNSIDLPLSPSNMLMLLKEMHDCDMLVIQRKRYSGASLWRKIVSIINRVLIKILFPIISYGISDFNFTFIFRKSIYSIIKPNGDSPGFAQTEMILRARQAKIRVKTAVINYAARTVGKGALGKPSDIMWSLYDMFAFRFGKRDNNRETLIN